MKPGLGTTSDRVWPMAGKTWQQALLHGGVGVGG